MIANGNRAMAASRRLIVATSITFRCALVIGSKARVEVQQELPFVGGFGGSQRRP
jgi:hypothetical protein